MTRIYLSPPDAGPRERELVLDAIDSNWIAPVGPHIREFESAFADAVGMPHAVALSSGTAALHLGLQILGVAPGDHVLTSTLTFVATANAAAYRGASIGFVDVDAASWTIDPDLLEEEIEARNRANTLPRVVITVDLYGQCADYDRIGEICGRYEIPVLEDAAEALGATYKGRQAGRFGRAAAFSFNGNKIITTGGGGMLVSSDRAIVERARYLSAQAQEPLPHYEHRQVGYNYRMSNLLAALGRAQLETLDARVEARRRGKRQYEGALKAMPGIEFMPDATRGCPTNWLTVVTVDPHLFGATREQIRAHLETLDIETRPVWKPMHLQPVFAHCPVRGGGVAERLFETGLCLPSGSSLTDEDRDRVVQGLRTTPRTARQEPRGSVR